MNTAQVDAEILLQLERRRPHAIELLYDHYGRLAYTLAFRIVGDVSTAEDVVQDVVLTVWRRGQTFDPSRGSLRPWLCSLVRNRAIDVIRKRSRANEMTAPLDEVAEAATGDVWAEVVQRLEQTEIRTALSTLTDEQRQTIELAYFSGLSQSEISERLGIPLGTVKGRARLGLGNLRRALEAASVWVPES